MASAWASFMDAQALKLLWSVHAETLVIRYAGDPATITGTWKRLSPDAPHEADLAGLTTYTGLALLVVKRADLRTPTETSKWEIDREGQTWHVTEVEPQDEWTYILHLSRRNPNRAAPRR